MRVARIAAIATIIVGLGTTVYAQQTMTGKIASVDEAARKIGVNIDGSTVGAEGPTAPTLFKVQVGLALTSLKPGDRILFSSQNINNVLTIESIRKQ